MATLEQRDKSLDSRHISNVQNIHLYEAARNSFFVLEVAPDQLQNLVRPDVNPDVTAQQANSKDYLDAKKASEYLRLNVVKVKLPGFTINQQRYRRGNNEVKYAGTPEFSDGSIVVDDVVGLDTKSILYAWLYLAYNPKTRKGGRMKDYKKKATLIEYTQDYEPIRQWNLHGCFILGIDEADFDKENDGPRQLTVNLSVDYCDQDLQGISETSYWIQSEQSEA